MLPRDYSVFDEKKVSKNCFINVLFDLVFLDVVNKMSELRPANKLNKSERDREIKIKNNKIP